MERAQADLPADLSQAKALVGMAVDEFHGTADIAQLASSSCIIWPATPARAITGFLGGPVIREKFDTIALRPLAGTRGAAINTSGAHGVDKSFIGVEVARQNQTPFPVVIHDHFDLLRGGGIVNFREEQILSEYCLQKAVQAAGRQTSKSQNG